MNTIVTDQDFEHRVIESPKPVLVAFGARWSGATQLMLQMVARLWPRYADRVRFEQIDVDLNPQIPVRLGVHTVPVMLLFLRGEVVAGFTPGASRRLVATQLDAVCEEARLDSSLPSPSMRSLGAAILGILLFALPACDSGFDPPELDHPCVSWCNTIAPWSHDGNPLETDLFTIYTDGASRETLEELATIAEGVLTDLMQLMEIEDRAIFVLPPGQSKIHLYAYRYFDPGKWGGQAFLGGMLIFSRDHRRLAEQDVTELAQYTRLVTHEMMHVLQNVLVGSAHSYSTHTWFEEGIAEELSAVNAELSVRSLADLDALVAEFGEHNPISITNDILPDIPNVGVRYFYPMFELTMRYALDSGGLGGSPVDAKEVFLDMRSGVSFEDAFENRFGLAVNTLEAEYFDRIRAWLE